MIPDGYIDGGRGMRLDATRHATWDREILCVDRARNAALADALSFARALRDLPPFERVERIAARIHQQITPPGEMRCVGRSTEQLETEYKNRPILIGDRVDQAEAGVCRHRALLFKLLADEAGLGVALVRGNYGSRGQPGMAHAWNELVLGDGRRVLLDVTLNGGKPMLPEIRTPDVIEHYLKVDDTPWYGRSANPRH
jgi:hypothetical protein